MLVGLGLLSSQALGCLPSDFHELSQSRENAAAFCDASSCFDAAQAAPPVLDASPCKVQRCADASLVDASIAPEDAGAEPMADAQTPEPPPPPPPCGGNATVCEANQTDMEQEACGACGSGTRTRTRTCAADGCSFGEWSAFGDCSGEHTECDPNGAAQTQTVSCPTCGSKTQKRTCSPTTCKWGAWSDSSACSWCDECSEVVYCDTPANIADRGTWCRQKACSREQALADCKEDVQNVCGGFTQPFLMEYK
jgi:hypothetical protein